jgi:hypothetical protein
MTSRGIESRLKAFFACNIAIIVFETVQGKQVRAKAWMDAAERNAAFRYDHCGAANALQKRPEASLETLITPLFHIGCNAAGNAHSTYLVALVMCSVVNIGVAGEWPEEAMVRRALYAKFSLNRSLRMISLGFEAFQSPDPPAPA